MIEPSASEAAAESQRTLVETQQKLSLALNATELGLWSWDSETNQLVWDDRMRELHGFDEPLAPRAYSEKLVHPEDRHLIETLFRSLPSGSFPQTSYRIVRPDGSVRWLLLVGQATLDESGRLRRVMGGSLDVTRQRELEEQLRKSQKMTAITSLTAGIAHNFNNMLAVILPILEFATGVVPRQHQRLLNDATHAALRAAELVEQLMTYAGQATSHRRKSCDVDELVRAAVSFCRRAFDAHITLKIKQSATPLSVVCNPGQVEQVLVNLLLNARDAINEANLEKGVITVRVRASSDSTSVSQGFVCFDVSDNGAGLSNEARAHLFEPFFTTKGIGKGTGLGLATSYAIARDHGGMLTCPSSGKRGTQFTLHLPLDPSLAAVEPVRAPEPKPQTGTRLLLVDDDDAVRTTLRSVLSALGHTVFQAESGAEALEQVRAHPDIQVILLDRSMPGGHGETFIPALRSLAPETPIVFVSGRAIDAQLSVLADAVVMKPVTGSALMAVVQQVLEEKKS